MAHRRNYSITWSVTTASSAATSAVLSTGNTVRPAIFDLIIGCSGTPADNALIWSLQRFTAAGTSTAYVPPPLDSGDPAAISVGGVTCTIEPTYTSAKILMAISLNQRATHRWVADPDAHLVIPATASNGIGCYTLHASYTGLNGGTVFFYE